MNKFVTALAGTADGIKLKRAINTATAVELAQEALINEKRSIVQKLEANLTNHLDIGPDSADSLRPTTREFNASIWVAVTQDLKVSLKRAQEGLEIAEDTYATWFTDAAAPAPVAAS